MIKIKIDQKDPDTWVKLCDPHFSFIKEREKAKVDWEIMQIKEAFRSKIGRDITPDDIIQPLTHINWNLGLVAYTYKNIHLITIQH